MGNPIQPFLINSYRSYPFEHPLAPGIHEANNEDENEDDAFDNSEHSKLTQFHRPREQEHRLHIEYQEYQCKNIVLGFELYPGWPHCFYATLIRCLLDGVWFLGSQNPGCSDCPNGNDQSHDQEQSYIYP